MPARPTLINLGRLLRISAFRFVAIGAVFLGNALLAPAIAADAQAHSPLLLAQAQPPQRQPTMQQRAAMVRQWLQASQMQMRAYEWVETTVVSLKGEEKSRVQKRCYYGVDGKVQKITLQDSSSQKSGPPGALSFGRMAKRAAEHKKEEMTEYMHKAEQLVHSYIPPNPGMIQQSVNAGKLGLQVLDPGRRARLNFADYLKPGDTLGIELELPTNRLLGVVVTSYLDSPNDAIALNVGLSVLPDGTIYPTRSALNAKAKGINVVVENTGYRRFAR